MCVCVCAWPLWNKNWEDLHVSHRWVMSLCNPQHVLSSNDTFAPVDSAVRDPKSRSVSSRKVPSAFLQRNAKPTNQKVLPVAALWLHYLLILPLWCPMMFSNALSCSIRVCHLRDSYFCCCCRSSCHCCVSKSLAGYLASQWPVPLIAPGSFVAVHPVVTRALQHAAWKLAPPGPGGMAGWSEGGWVIPSPTHAMW